MNKHLTINSDEKIAVLSDIHGNGLFLETAINMAIEKGATTFIILGDLLTDFQQNREVINMIKNLELKYKVILIKGNRDKDIIDIADGKNQHWKKTSISCPLLLAHESLTPENIAWFRTFKDYQTIDFDDNKIFITHSAKMSDNIKEKFGESKAKNILFAHIHMMYDKVLNGIRYLNSGAVGLSNDCIPYGGSFMIISSENKELKSEFCKFNLSKDECDNLISELNNNQDLKNIN